MRSPALRSQARHHRHVQHPPHLGPALGDVPPAAMLAAVVRHRRQPGQAGDLLLVKLAQLGQKRQQAGGRHRADAEHAEHQRGRAFQRLTLRQHPGDLALQLALLPAQAGERRLGPAEQGGRGVQPLLLGPGDDLAGQLVAVGQQLGQLQPVRSRVSLGRGRTVWP